ncbi:MAG: histidine triad nucleotide-binding protein [Acidobacteriota bacterium]|nr:histidine triad nucleotide-binding protein [Acidobacteriota bacterium]
MSDCIFCKIAGGDIPTELLYESEDVVAFNDLDPQAPVHVLIIPRRHISSLLEIGETDAILAELQSAAIEIARQRGLGETGFRLVTNCLEDGGQAVFHLHLHLLGGRRMGWPPG